MIFKPHHIDLIIAGQKTQTRRRAQYGEHLVCTKAATCVYYGSGVQKWRVGNHYSVQPGRTQPGAKWHPGFRMWNPLVVNPQELIPLLIEITDLRMEKLQDISVGDCIDEGYPYPLPHDPDYLAGQYPDPITWYRDLWDEINPRWPWRLNLDVFVIQFKLVKE